MLIYSHVLRITLAFKGKVSHCDVVMWPPLTYISLKRNRIKGLLKASGPAEVKA